MNNFKTFSTFEEGITELCKLVPSIKSYTKDAKTEEEVVSNLLEIIKNNFPSIYDPEYPATYAINISDSQVGFKTKAFYGFGWKIQADPQNNKVSYSFRVSFNHPQRIRSIAITRIEEDLKAANWIQVESKPRRQYIKSNETETPQS